MKNKIRFADLNIWLILAIISAWITGIVYIFYFMVGFFGAL